MTSLKCLILSLFAFSCGTEDKVLTDLGLQQEPISTRAYRGPLTVDPDFTNIYASFISDGLKYKANMWRLTLLTSIKYVDKMDSSIIGTCYYNHDNKGEYRYIRVLKSPTTTQTRLRTLLYHELGHCVLNLDHTPENSNTIMQPHILDDAYAEKNWDALVQQEFESEQQ